MDGARWGWYLWSAAVCGKDPEDFAVLWSGPQHSLLGEAWTLSCQLRREAVGLPVVEGWTRWSRSGDTSDGVMLLRLDYA
jgi:hypothetical protein